MKHGSFLGVSNEGGPKGHQFPRGTLLVSTCLLVGGLRLAGLMPTPSLPRLPAPTMVQAAVLSDDNPRLSPFSAAPVPPVSRFLTKTAPGNAITAAEVRFQPIRAPIGPLTAEIRAVSDNGRVVLTDIRKGNVLWSGPITEARFIYSDIAASRTLKDSRGQVLWSEIPVPDLSLNRSADGKACLRDRQGRTLWEGLLVPSPQAAVLPSRGERRQSLCSVDFAGIKLRGINGSFTLTDESGRETRTLWSGAVPGNEPPILLLRDGHRFFYWGDRGPVASSDRVTTIQMQEEAGQVMITDPPARIVGRQAVPLLKITSAVQLVGEERLLPIPCQCYVPFANLTKAGCALFTYRDRMGNVVLTNSVVRDGDRQRITNNHGQSL